MPEAPPATPIAASGRPSDDRSRAPSWRAATDRDTVVPVSDDPDGDGLPSGREHEHEHGDHLSRITDGYLAVDTDWTVTDVSTPGAELVDRSPEAMVGRDMWDVFPGGVDTRFEREYERARETDEPTTFRAQYAPLDTWFEVSAYPEDGGLAIYFRDVTERVERARLSERLNEATGRLHGATTVEETWGEAVEIVESTLGLPLVSCRQRVDDRLVPVAVSESARRYDLEPVGPDHELWRAFEATAFTVTDPDEDLDGVDRVALFPLGEHGLLGVGDCETAEYPTYLLEAGGTLAEHVTTALDRAVREERLRERERSLGRYETIVQAAGDPIYWLDEAGRFKRVNDRMVAITGHDRETLVGAHASIVLPDHDVAACEQAIRSIVSGEQSPPVTVPLELRVADGTTRYCEVAIAPLYVDDRLQGTVGVLRDRTDLRRREQRLVVMDRVLRHTLRNKMNVVLGELTHLEDTDHVSVIREAATDLLSLSDDARRFEDVIDPEGDRTISLDLTAATRRVVDDFQRGHPAAQFDLDLQEDATVAANPAVEMALGELVENALTHAGAAPTVTVTLRRDGDWVIVEVGDDGPGIDPAELEALEMGTERPLTHASGLGLWLVNWTVESSGGDIRFETGDGTTVSLRLPADTSA